MSKARSIAAGLVTYLRARGRGDAETVFKVRCRGNAVHCLIGVKAMRIIDLGFASAEYGSVLEERADLAPCLLAVAAMAVATRSGAWFSPWLC